MSVTALDTCFKLDLPGRRFLELYPGGNEITAIDWDSEARDGGYLLGDFGTWSDALRFCRVYQSAALGGLS